ncbi:LCP family protein [Enterococcus villorum]|uniref:Regulatory protein MsrR n=2 Tax=Enterococcus villorum TaxID=112904 RepID=A0A511IYA6_9ENTE|nr:LCP family protein [Enterococcus villorum]EOH89813.1 transcriptional regulator PSR [Enterococcus villorum ATCC 700913]EOW78045.1 transcriptional regulator PSR [Enterococcus villorum ATCC 700913]GEL90760.1 transcriptional regulator [Enterococcus villorum]
MSRMDRYKNIHKKAKPLKNETDNLFRRTHKNKKEKQHQVETDDATRIYRKYQEAPNSFEDEEVYGSSQPHRIFSDTKEKNSYQEKKSFFKGKKGKDSFQAKKTKKKRSWKKIVLGIFLFLVLFSIISFFVGKFVAEHDTSLQSVTTETFNGVPSSSGAHNVLILGSDTRGEDAGRADTIMVLQLDGPAHKPKLISFMRDSFVTIPGVGQNKINSAYAYGGADLVRQTIKENFGIDCQYYAKVDFKSFEKVIDALFMTGVKIDAEKELNLDGVDIKKGVQKMDGHVLLQYARFRMDEEGDFGRVRRQQQVMNAIFNQLKNPLNLIRSPYAAGKAIGYTSTNVSAFFLVKNLFSIARGVGGIDRLSVPVDGSWNFGNSSYAGSVLVIDNEANKVAISDFLSK